MDEMRPAGASAARDSLRPPRQRASRACVRLRPGAGRRSSPRPPAASILRLRSDDSAGAPGDRGRADRHLLAIYAIRSSWTGRGVLRAHGRPGRVLRRDGQAPCSTASVLLRVRRQDRASSPPRAAPTARLPHRHRGRGVLGLHRARVQAPGRDPRGRVPPWDGKARRLEGGLDRSVTVSRGDGTLAARRGLRGRLAAAQPSLPGSRRGRPCLR